MIIRIQGHKYAHKYGKEHETALLELGRYGKSISFKTPTVVNVCAPILILC